MLKKRIKIKNHKKRKSCENEGKEEAVSLSLGETLEKWIIFQSLYFSF